MKKARLTTLYLTLALVASILSLTACGPKATQLGENDNGKQVTLQVGESLTISLPGNPSTGYSWEVKSVDTTLLEQKGEAQFESSNTGLVGAGGTLILTFETLKAGSTTLELVYLRPWESDVEPLQTYSVEITVK